MQPSVAQDGPSGGGNGPSALEVCPARGVSSRMAPDFQSGVEATQVGDSSEVIETPFGYHVILRTR
jgi:hypothetical protein